MVPNVNNCLHFNLPITLWSLGQVTKKISAVFLSLSLLSIDLYIADVILAMFCRLVPIKLAIFVARPIRLFSVIKKQQINTGIWAYLARMVTACTMSATYDLMTSNQIAGE